MSTFKSNLRQAREKLGLNAKDIAEKLGVTPQTYSNYENKGTEPKYDVLIKLTKILNVTADQLLGNIVIIDETAEIAALVAQAIDNDATYKIEKIEKDKITVRVFFSSDPNFQRIELDLNYLLYCLRHEKDQTEIEQLEIQNAHKTAFLNKIQDYIETLHFRLLKNYSPGELSKAFFKELDQKKADNEKK